LHPVCAAARRSAFQGLAIEVVKRRNRREAVAVVQTVHIDNSAAFDNSADFALGHVRDSRNEDTALSADQEIASASAKAVILHDRPVVSPNLDESLAVGEHAGIMTTTEGTGARAQRIVFWPLGKPKSYMDVAAVTSAEVIHPSEPMEHRIGVNRSWSGIRSATLSYWRLEIPERVFDRHYFCHGKRNCK
jgi:hypothetical protein